MLIVTSVLVTVALTILTFYDDKHNVRRRHRLHQDACAPANALLLFPAGLAARAQMATNLENAWYAEYEANPHSPILESLETDVRRGARSVGRTASAADARGPAVVAAPAPGAVHLLRVQRPS